MHISLDSALGRQRRLNSVGESVFQIAPDAAAGYSLRSLTGGDPAVVRVRRESDNNERDFNASGVSSGELVNWVNEQITPPLDLRELTATGRDGPIIEAAAAYSLRNLSDSYTGSVVEVRRSSDDAVRSFTATEVTDGTLEAWVTANQTSRVNFAEGNNNWLSYDGGADDIFKFGTYGTSSSRAAYNHITDEDNIGGSPVSDSDYSFRFDSRASEGFNTGHGLKIETREDSQIPFNVTFKYFIPEGQPSLQVTYASATSGNYSTKGAWTEVTVRNSVHISTGVLLRIGSGTTGGLFYIADVRIESDTSNGFVSKWYDQSTTSGVPNAKHAVQTSAASQPKIVDGGSLNTSDGLDFDGVNDRLTASGIGASSQPNTIVQVFSASTSVPADYQIDAGNTLMLTGGDSSIYYFCGALLNSGVDFPTNGKTVHSTICNSSSSTIHVDGALGNSGNIGSGNMSGTVSIGSRTSGAQASKISYNELIIYHTDQTDNRTALEANIGEVYGISGIPAYEDTVNGFVETWYDQSGNDNDATQLTAGSQPKIVDAGTLVSGGILSDGAGTFLELDSTLSISDEFDIFFTGTATASDWTGLQRSPYGFSTNSDYPRFNDDSFRYTISSSDSGTIDYNSGFTIGAGTPFLYNFNRDVSDSVGAQINGTAQTNRVTLTGTHQISQLFRRGANTSQVWDGTMSEMIFYPSDQSANRPAIEANINNQYDIY